MLAVGQFHLSPEPRSLPCDEAHVLAHARCPLILQLKERHQRNPLAGSKRTARRDHPHRSLLPGSRLPLTARLYWREPTVPCVEGGRHEGRDAGEFPADQQH
jgi:hypothetical protein